MDDITLYLAIWGAALSTIAILWNIFRDLNDKGKLKVNFFIGNELGEVDDQKDFIVFKVLNIGKKPITVTQVGGGFEKTHLIINSLELPKLLNPTDYVIIRDFDFSIFERDLKFLGAWDSTNKIWKVKKKTQKYWTNKFLNEIKKEYK